MFSFDDEVVNRLISLFFVIGSIVAIFVGFGYFLSHPINLVTADVGRHIQNGAVLFEEGSIVTTNFYSYIHPDFFTLNHHWGAGILFFVVWKFFDVSGVHVLFIFLSLVSLGVFLKAASNRGGVSVAILSCLPLVPLVAHRTEIRPEILSSLFVGLFLLLLWRYRDNPNKGTYRWLFVLPLIELIWVNTHIYFILGPLVMGTFLVEFLFTDREKFKKLVAVFGVVCVSTFINPFFWKGVVAPFFIFRNFGYMLAENQSVWFMTERSTNPNLVIFKIMFGVLVVSFVVSLWKNRNRKQISDFLLVCGFSVMAWFAVRNIALFGFVALPILTANITSLFPRGIVRYADVLKKVAFGVSVVALVVLLSGNLASHFPYWRSFGIGAEEGNNDATDFFLDNGLKGPIFNNYDNGGYLIFHLYPEEKVFVDNRPEAYPDGFFSDVYIPMQEDEEVWNQMEERYGFNVIFFAYNDMTPWAQEFLIQRVQDESWVPVYVDTYSLIFLKDNEVNADLIRKFALPRSMFGVRKL